jgi:hypothetical protein
MAINSARNNSIRFCENRTKPRVQVLKAAVKHDVAAVAQQCIEEGVNLKVWVETRVYFKILS